MSQLTMQQASVFAQQAGFSGQNLAQILAISQAESGLNTDAVNTSDPYGGSWGILQINGAHFNSGATTKACALDPACAYQYAFQLSNGGKNFNDWGTYTSGAYRQYLTQAEKNANSPTGSPLGSIIGSQASSTPASTNCAPWDISCITTALRGGVVKTGIFLLGLLLFVIGVLMLIWHSPASDVVKKVINV